MPIYEYVCVDCQTLFEELRPSTRMDEPADCPSGHPTGRRVLSRFATLTRTGGESSMLPESTGCGGGCTDCACSN